MQDLADNAKFQVIRGYVLKERERRNLIELVTGHQSERSCEMFGEARNLVEHQLMLRPVEEWPDELSDHDVLDMVFKYVEKEIGPEKMKAVA